MRQLDVDVGDELVLYVTDRGEGPPLVLLHGFTGSSESWATMIPALSAAHRVITVDLPGHGQSSAPANPQRYALDFFAEDLIRVLDSLSLKRVAVMGYSMGGRAALRFGAVHSDRVAALILESTSPGISDREARSARVASDAALADFIAESGIEAFVDRWESLPLWESQRALPGDVRARLRQQRLANRPDGMSNSLRGAGAGADIPTPDRLRGISAPARVIVGALDTAYIEFGKTLVTSLPNAGMTIVPNAGHAVHLEQPEALTDVILAFLRGVPSAGGQWL